MKNTLTMVETIEMGPSVSANHIVFISHHIKHFASMLLAHATICFLDSPLCWVIISRFGAKSIPVKEDTHKIHIPVRC